VLVAGIAVAGVRSSRTKNEAGPGGVPTASETPLQTVPETPTVSETPTVEQPSSEQPSPSVTMTFSGLPPFAQSGTPSPSASAGAKLPHTGVPDGGFFASGMLMLLLALAAAGLLLREQR
jgi:hypothetical protein